MHSVRAVCAACCSPRARAVGAKRTARQMHSCGMLDACATTEAAARVASAADCYMQAALKEPRSSAAVCGVLRLHQRWIDTPRADGAALAERVATLSAKVAATQSAGAARRCGDALMASRVAAVAQPAQSSSLPGPLSPSPPSSPSQPSPPPSSQPQPSSPPQTPPQTPPSPPPPQVSPLAQARRQRESQDPPQPAAAPTPLERPAAAVERLGRGRGLALAGRLAEAAAVLAEAAGVAPRWAEPRLLLGLCQSQLGRADAALASLGTALELSGPRPPARREQRAEYEELRTTAYFERANVQVRVGSSSSSSSIYQIPNTEHVAYRLVRTLAYKRGVGIRETVWVGRPATHRTPGCRPTRADCHLSMEALALMHLAILTQTV